MFREYLIKNRTLFWFSLIIFAKIVLIWLCCLCAYNAEMNFRSIKTDKNINLTESSSFNFWKYLWYSGEVMSSYGNVWRLKDYQNAVVPSLIIKFFRLVGANTTTETVSSIKIHQTSPNIASTMFYFHGLAKYLQICLALISSAGLLALINVLLFGRIIWGYLLSSRAYNFYKLFMCTVLNIFGFLYIYSWEQNLVETGMWDRKFRRSWLLSRTPLVKLAHKIKDTKNDFDLSSKSNNMVMIKNLSYEIPLGKNFIKEFFTGQKEVKKILRNVNLEIKKGSFTVIVGPNGSGKTSLIKTIINLTNRDNVSGQILWNNQDISEINQTSFARGVSYIPQFLNVEHSMSAIDFLSFSRYPYKEVEGNSVLKDKELIFKAIQDNGCEQIAIKMVDEMSGGQKQKLLLTSVLAQETEIIVLDEPTSFLDIKNQYLFLEVLKKFHKLGKTIIMILHDLQQSINYADNLVVMKDGEVKAVGHPKEIVTKSLLRDTFLIDCDIVPEGGQIKLKNIESVA